MKYKFFSVRINVTKHDIIFATRGGYATAGTISFTPIKSRAARLFNEPTKSGQ